MIAIRRLTCLLLLLAGCDFFDKTGAYIEHHCAWLERRKEPDMLTVSPEVAARLAKPPKQRRYDSRVTPKERWEIHTTLLNRAALHDNDPSTGAITGPGPHLTQWILIDLGEECCFQNVMQHLSDAQSVPSCYRIDVAGCEGFPYVLMFHGNGSHAVLCEPVRARFLRITLIQDTDRPWSVAEIAID